MDEKPPIVIELTTSLRTGVTSLVGISAAPCPVCKKQNTALMGGIVVCKEEGCPGKIKVA